MKNFITQYFQGIIQHPEKLIITEKSISNIKKEIIIQCAHSDKKKIIGPRGLIIQTLRNICVFQNPTIQYTITLLE